MLLNVSRKHINNLFHHLNRDAWASFRKQWRRCYRHVTGLLLKWCTVHIKWLVELVYKINSQQFFNRSYTNKLKTNRVTCRYRAKYDYICISIYGVLISYPVTFCFALSTSHCFIPYSIVNKRGNDFPIDICRPIYSFSLKICKCLSSSDAATAPLKHSSFHTAGTLHESYVNTSLTLWQDSQNGTNLIGLILIR